MIVWSDGTTDFSGSISATGGSESGNGGFVETSGKDIVLSELLVLWHLMVRMELT